METSGEPTPSEAAAALADAEQSGATLARDLRLPSFFHGAIAVAITVQIATSALGIAVDEPWARVLLVAGLAGFVTVAVVLLALFRRINGVWVSGLASRVVLGTGAEASVAYALGFAAATWAALAELWWLVPLAALAGGLGYAVSGRRWVRTYRGDPVTHSRAESLGWLAVMSALAIVGLVLLLAGR